MSGEQQQLTPDAALGAQVEPQPPITFQFNGKTVTLEVPFKLPVWFWILTHPGSGLDPNDDEDSLFKSLASCVALESKRILSVATGLTTVDLEAGVEPAELTRVMREVAEQLGRELTASSPFSNFKDALEATKRVALLARGAWASSGARQSEASKPNSTAARRARRGE
jgi:hypothetical protein